MTLNLDLKALSFLKKICVNYETSVNIETAFNCIYIIIYPTLEFPNIGLKIDRESKKIATVFTPDHFQHSMLEMYVYFNWVRHLCLSAVKQPADVFLGSHRKDGYLEMLMIVDTREVKPLQNITFPNKSKLEGRLLIRDTFHCYWSSIFVNSDQTFFDLFLHL